MTFTLKRVALCTLLASSALASSLASAQSVTVISYGGAIQNAQRQAYYGPFEKAPAPR